MKKLRIKKRGLIIIAILCVIGFLWYQSGSLFVESTNLENVVINDYAIDNTQKKIEIMEQGITLEDVTNTLGDNYRKGAYDSTRKLYMITYYDKENEIAMGFVYAKEAGNLVGYVIIEEM